jgi:hypothetical protein
VTWTIVDSTGATTCSGGPYSNNMANTEDCCLLNGNTYTLNCIDSYGDGWHNGYISIDGVQYCNGFLTGSLETHTVSIGQDCALSSVTMNTATWGNEVTWTITQDGTTVCSGGPYSNNQANLAECCLFEGVAYTLNCLDSWGDGWHGGNMQIGTENYCSGFTTGTSETHDFTLGASTCVVNDVTMTTESWGNEVTWSIVDSTGATVCSGGPYSNYLANTENCCLNDGAYTINCDDSYGDGWHGGYMTINGQTYCTGFWSGTHEEHDFWIGTALTCAVDSVSMTTVTWGNEVTWTIVDTTGTTVCSGGPYSNNVENSADCCL